MSKSVSIIILAFFAIISALDLETIPNNAWVQLTNIHHQFPSGYVGQFQKRFWCDFTWDADSQRILFWEGYLGDHGQETQSIYSNAIYTLDPENETVKMLNLSDYWVTHPSTDPTPGTGAETPHRRHAYGAFKYVSKYHNIYMEFGAAGYEAGCDLKTLWKYGTITQTWTKAATVADNSIPEPGCHFAWLPGSDTLWLFAPDGGTWVNLYALNLRTEQYSEQIDYGPKTSRLLHVAEDTLRRQIMVWSLAGNAHHFYLFNPATLRFNEITNLPAELPALTGGNGGEGAMVYNPKYDKYFIYFSTAGQVWTYNPADSAWTKVVTGNESARRIDDYLVYDPVHDITAIFDVDANYYVFRYAEAGMETEKTHGNKSAKLTVFPNPITNGSILKVGFGGKALSTYRIFDTKGRLVTDINQRGAPCGVYMLKWENGNEEYSQRIVKMN